MCKIRRENKDWECQNQRQKDHLKWKRPKKVVVVEESESESEEEQQQPVTNTRNMKSMLNKKYVQQQAPVKKPNFFAD